MMMTMMMMMMMMMMNKKFEFSRWFCSSTITYQCFISLVFLSSLFSFICLFICRSIVRVSYKCQPAAFGVDMFSSELLDLLKSINQSINQSIHLYAYDYLTNPCVRILLNISYAPL